MADEAIEVELSADNRSFIRSFNEATKAVQTTAQGIGYLKGKFNQLEASIVQTTKKMAMMTGGAIAASGAFAGFAVKSFASLEEQMMNVSTVADLTQMSVGQMTEAIRKMALEIPKSAEELASGLYDVNSAGFQGAEGLAVLDASARFAQAGLTDVSTSVRGVTALLNAYGMGASQAGYVTDILFKSIETGQMTAEEFISTIGVFASSAAALDVPISTVAATMATLTKGGMNAAMASTSLNAIFKQLMTPGDELAKVIKRLGYETGQAMVEQEGLANTLALIREHAGSDSAFAELLGELEAIRGSLLLTGTQYEEFIATDQEFANSAAVTGTVTRNFDKQMQSLSAQLGLLGNSWREFRLEVAEIVVPIVRVGVALTTGILNAINKMPEPIRKIVAGFSLLVPAMAVFAGYAATSAIRVMLLSKAMNMLAASKVVGMIPGLRTLILQFSAMGGLRGIVKTFFTTLVTGSNAARTAMLKMAAQATLAMASMAAFAAIIYQFTLGLRNTIREVDATVDALQGFSNAEDSLASIEERLQAIAVESERVSQYKDMGVFASGWFALKATLQGVASILPGIDWTVLQDARMAQTIDGAAEGLRRFRSGLSQMAQDQQMFTDDFIRGFKALESQGIVSGEEMFTIYNELARLATDYAMTANVAMMEAGQTDGFIDDKSLKEVQDFKRDLDAASQAWNEYMGIVGPAVKEASEEIDRLAEAQMRAGIASGDLENALFTMGDEAATAKEKMDALIGALNILLGQGLGSAQAEAQLGSAFRNFADLVEDGNFSLEVFSERGELTVGVLSGLNSAIIGVAEAAYYQSGDVNQAAAIMLGYAEAVAQAARDAGIAEGDVQAMLEMMSLTPETLVTVLGMAGVDESILDIQTVQAYLAGLDGFVASPTIDLQFSLGGNDLGFYSRQINDVVRESTSSLVNRIARSSGRGSSRDPEFQLTEEQKRLIAEALARPIINNFTGDAFYAQIQEEADAVHTSAVEHAFMAIPSRVSASILQAAGESGRDPAQQINELAELYIRAAQLVGESEAMLAAQFYDSLEGFRNWVSEIEKIQELHRAKEDYLFSTGGIDNGAYIDILNERLAATEEYSQEWIGLMNQIASIQEQSAQESQRLENNQFAAGDMATETYLGILRNRLNGLEQYSDEYMQIMGDIRAIESDVEAEAYRRASAMYEMDATSTADYLSFLRDRLDGLEQYSSDYMAIMREISQIEDSEHDRAVNREAARYELGETSREDYIAGLEDRLEALEKYSDEYMSVWAELRALNEEIASEEEQAAREAEERAREEERRNSYQYELNETTREEYLAYLNELLSGLEQYSDDYMAIWREIQGLNQEIADEEQAALDEANRLADAQYELGETEREDYLAHLESMLEGLEMYSEEYLSVWREIEAIRKEILREEEDAAKEQERILERQENALLDWRDSIVDAFNRISDSVTDPIYRATDLVSAFGDQADVSLSQIRGFYENMEQGTSRWIDTIRGLQEQGVDQEFLQQLISEGPQSLGFAESILGMGADAISLINNSMAGIRELTDEFGNEYASGQTGNLVQNQTNFTIDIGGISIELGEGTGLTADQVQQAVTDALQSIADQLAAGNYG